MDHLVEGLAGMASISDHAQHRRHRAIRPASRRGYGVAVARRPGSLWSHDLPDPATRLIGRDDEVTRLRELLGRWRGCVVTIVGPGGCGKTRLALAVARESETLFADGAVFVGLADLDDARLVATEIGRVLGLVEGGGAGPAERLVAALASRRLLVVVDNLEHLVAAGPMLAQVAAR